MERWGEGCRGRRTREVERAEGEGRGAGEGCQQRNFMAKIHGVEKWLLTMEINNHTRRLGGWSLSMHRRLQCPYSL